MENKKYHDQIKGILLKQGYNSYDIDSRVMAVINYCNKNDIAVTAFSPLGNAELLKEKSLIELVKKVDKSLAQVILKWLVDKGIIVIPRSTSTEHMKENLDLFSWDLPEEVFNGIEQLDKELRVRDPEFGEFDMEE